MLGMLAGSGKHAEIVDEAYADGGGGAVVEKKLVRREKERKLD